MPGKRKVALARCLTHKVDERCWRGKVAFIVPRGVGPREARYSARDTFRSFFPPPPSLPLSPPRSFTRVFSIFHIHDIIYPSRSLVCVRGSALSISRRRRLGLIPTVLTTLVLAEKLLYSRSSRSFYSR